MDTVYRLFKKIVELNPNDTAIIENKRTLSFRDLSNMVDNIGSHIPIESKNIGIIIRHCAEMIAAIFAVIKCGKLYVPVETDFPQNRINYMFKDAEVDYVITSKECTQMVENFPYAIIDDISVPNNTQKQTFIEENLSNINAPVYILYTSGSTGCPKGVCVTNKNLSNYITAFAKEFNPKKGDIMLQNSVCSFDIFVEEVFSSLLNGAALAIPSAEDKRNINSLMNFVEKNNVTIISCFPYLLAEMNHLPSIPSKLRLLISGRDILRKKYIDKLLNQVSIYNTYGPSETTVCATYFKCSKGNDLENGTYPIGHEIKGVKVRLINSGRKEVNVGDVGEICISGLGVSNGYIGNAKLENKSFVKNNDEEIIYHSGDLGYKLSDGNYVFIGRKDMQVMIYGKRVEITEVEEQLYKCKNISQAIVCNYKDNNELDYLVAYIVPTKKNIQLTEIKMELRKFLPEYMIPDFFVKMNSIPINENGKPDRLNMPMVMKESKI